MSGRWRIARRAAAASALLLAVAACALWFGRDELLRMAVDQALPDDGSISLGQVRWTGWLRVQADDVQLRQRDWSGRIGSLEARASFDWRAGLALEEARLSGVQVAGSSGEGRADAAGGLPMAAVLPEGLPRIGIESLDADWALADGRTLALRGGRLELDGLRLDVQADSLRFGSPELVLSAPFLARLRGGEDRRSVELAEWRWDPRLDVRGGRLDWSSGRLRIEVDARACDGEVRIEALAGEGQVDADLRLRGIDARAAAALSGAPACSGRLDLDARLSLPLDDPARARLDAQVSLAGGSVDGVELDATGAVQFEHGRLDVRNALLRSGANVAWIACASLPVADAMPCEWPATAALAADVRLSDLSLALADARATTDASATLRIRLLDGDLRLDGSSIESDDGRASIDELRLSLPLLLESGAARTALVELSRDERTRLRAKLDFHDLGDTLRLFGLAPPDSDEEFLGRADGACSVQGGPQGARLELDLRVHGARVLDVRVDELDLHGVLDDGAARRARLEVAAQTSLGKVAGSGSWDIDERRIDVQGNLELPELARLPFPLKVAGGARANLRLQGPLDDLDGFVDLQAEQLSVEGVELGALRLEAERQGPQWAVRRAEASWQGVAFALAGEATRGPDGTIRARLEEASIRRGPRVWRLEAPAELALDSQGVATGVARWKGDEGALVAGVELELDTMQGSIELAGALHDLQRVADVPILARATDVQWDGSVRIELAGRPRAVSAEGTARLLLADMPSALALRGKAMWTPERLAVDLDELVLEDPAAGAHLVHGELHAVLPLADGALARSGDTTIALDLHAADIERALPPGPASRLSGSLDIRARLSGTPSALAGEASLGLGAWRLRSAAGDGEIGPFHAQLEARFGPDGIAVSAAQASLQGVTRTTIDGRIDVAPDLTALLAEPALLLDAPVRIEAGGELGDLSPLAGRLDAVRRLRGSIKGRVVVSGSMRRPALDGEVRLEHGELRLAADIPSMSELQATVRFDDSRAELVDARGELGGAPFVLRGGARWDEGAPMLDLRIEGEELLLLRSRHLTVRADAKLALSGPADAPLCSGSVVLVDGRWTRPLDPLTLALRPRSPRGDDKDGLFRLDDPFGSRLRFDVQIESRAPFRVENELLRAGLSPSLKLGGTGALPVLAGEVRLEPSRAYLPASVVELEGGAFRFRPSRPDTIELELAGRTTALGYDVSIQVGGTVDDPLVTLSSSPPASREDLALLVLTGRPPGGSVFGSGERAARGVALYVARDLLSSGPSEPGSMLERVEIASGARTSRRGLDTIQLRLRIGGEGRDEALYLVAERDVHEDWNYGVRFVWRPQ